MEDLKFTIELSGHSFKQPKKCIHDNGDLEKFLKSKAAGMLIGFIQKLSEKVENKALSVTQTPGHLEGLVKVFYKLNELITETPPIEQPMRYGNKAFQTWHDKMTGLKSEIAKMIFGDEESAAKFKDAWDEIFVYFQDSFGDRTRLDYGTGHELNMLVSLLSLYSLGVLKDDDLEATVNVVFAKYLALMRRIQTTYFLEPAGSHGVWGLDDYQFLPFIFGASQLKNHAQYTPNSIHSEGNLNQDHKDYMYFDCVKFIKEMKKGVPFGESSPLLNDISGVPTWGKVAQGLQKMYMVEVMGKLPVMKHLRFGSILQF